MDGAHKDGSGELGHLDRYPWNPWNNRTHSDIVFVWNRLLRILVNQRTNELRHARDYLSEEFNSIPTVMIGVGPEGNIVRVNAACRGCFRLLAILGKLGGFPFLSKSLSIPL